VPQEIVIANDFALFLIARTCYWDLQRFRVNNILNQEGHQTHGAIMSKLVRSGNQNNATSTFNFTEERGKKHWKINWICHQKKLFCKRKVSF